MKLKFFVLGTVVITLSLVLMSCSNSPKQSRTIIGELSPSSPISADFSKFSGVESYKFTTSTESILNYEIKLRTGKTSISIVDENGNEYLNATAPIKDVITLNPSGETTYYIDLTYDNGVGSYSFSIDK